MATSLCWCFSWDRKNLCLPMYTFRPKAGADLNHCQLSVTLANVEKFDVYVYLLVQLRIAKVNTILLLSTCSTSGQLPDPHPDPHWLAVSGFAAYCQLHAPWVQRNTQKDLKSTGEKFLPSLRYLGRFYCLHDLRHEATHGLCCLVLLLLWRGCRCGG